MILHRNTLLSQDVLEKKFVCDLNACKGACCIEGDRGAPLDEEDIEAIKKYLPEVLDYLPESHRKDIEESGFYEVDVDDEPVTRCREDGECVFVVRNEIGQLQCAIEKAHRDDKIDYIKPISCHMYPIRRVKTSEFTGLNVHQWDICSAACTLGEKLEVPVYEFLKEPLIRAFGEEWYAELVEIAEAYSKQSS